jgi:hypothetical protein
MGVRLIKKFAERLDGIDLSAYKPGDTLDLEPSEAALLLAEGWAVREGPRHHLSAASHTSAPRATIAADSTSRR